MEKRNFFHLKNSFRARDIQIFVFLSYPFPLLFLSAISLEDDRG